MRLALIAVTALGFAATGAAAADNPLLLAKTYNGGDPNAPGQALRMERMAVQVILLGGTAEAVVEASFSNPTSEALEGDFTLALPAGAVVSGYALDVNGVMVEGVLTGKRQAQQVYEERVRAGVDPGLAEVTPDNAFHTRVFPILPGRGRTIRLKYVSPLAADGAFILPLESAQTVGRFSLTINSPTGGEEPTLAAPGGLRFQWQGDKGAARRAVAADTNVKLSGALTVGAWRPSRPLTLTRHSNGEQLFELRTPYDVRAALVRRVRIYWDRSRSRRDDDLKAEIELVARYIEAVRPETIELVTFADDTPRVVPVAGVSGAALRAALADVRYGGASSLERVFTAGAGRVDTCLVVSDGRPSLGSWTPAPPPCRTFTLSSAPDADRNFLTVMAGRGGGLHIDLTAVNPEAALARMTSAGPPSFTLTTNDRQAVDYRLLSGPNGRYWIIGKTPSADSLVLTGADGQAQTFPLGGEEIATDAVGALWGREAVAGLLAGDRPDREEALALARRYNVATSEATFLVLENAQDYVDAGVAPPPSAGGAIIGAYQQLMRDRKLSESGRVEDNFERVLTQWEEQKTWWERKPAPRPRPRPQDGGLPPPRVQPRPPVSAQSDAPPPPPLAIPPVERRVETPAPPVITQAPPAPAPPRPRGVEEVVVTGSRAREQREVSSPNRSQSPAIEVATVAWNPDRPYLKALQAAGPTHWDAVYAEQELRNGDAAMFYFDVAELAFRSGRREQAARIVVNVLDLPGVDSRTLITLADRLQRYGDIDHAIWLHERVLFLEPDRPQPRRNLALALIARGDGATGATRVADYRRALELLNVVITRPWDEDYLGVEMVALTEANALVAKMSRLGLTQTTLDPKLIAMLSVDVRAVLEWNTDKTDMDLWVDEPTGERAIYSNPATQIGGRLSNDMTRGYGPEEYLLRRAPSGRYVVQADVYAVDRLDPKGPTTVRVRLFRDWGKPSQKEETFEIELNGKENGGAVRVGEFAVAPPSAGPPAQSKRNAKPAPR